MTDRTNLPTTPDGQAQGFDLREALGFVWRQWKFVVAITALVCVIGAVMLFQQTPLYTASTQILLDREQQSPPGAQTGIPQMTVDLSMVNSQMAIIRSTAFLRRLSTPAQTLSA